MPRAHLGRIEPIGADLEWSLLAAFLTFGGQASTVP
jgi:hypothetical protein